MKKVILYSLNILTILSFVLSCDSQIKVENEDTLKKISSIFIEENGVEMIKWMMMDSINVMKVAIKKEEYLTSNETQPPPVGEEPIKFFYPNLNLYTFYYSMGVVEGDDNLPSNMFYVDGYPIFLYDDKKPFMDKKNIPQYLYRYKKIWVNDDYWLVAICRKSQKYIIFREYWKLGDEALDKLKKFNDKCSEDN